MKKGLRTMWIPLVAATFAWSACGDDDPVGGGGAPLPDLSGTYDLVSFSSEALTGGQVITPPAATGTFTLNRTQSGGTQASGTFTVNLLLPDPQGGQQPFIDQGDYAIEADGTWQQQGQLGSASGTYDLQGTTLTVVVTVPAPAAGVSVWERQ